MNSIVKIWNFTNTALRAFEPFGIAIAVIALIATFVQMWEERCARKEGRIVDAWQVVTTKASGNSGKKAALEYLHSEGRSLAGIDVSCKTMGGFDEKKQECERRTYLIGVNLSSRKSGIAILYQANLSGVDLRQSDLSGTHLAQSDLSNSLFFQSDLSDANLRYANFTNAQFRQTNISGAKFFGVSTLQQTQIEQMWAWEDRKPRNFPILFQSENDNPFYKLCDPLLRPKYVEAKKNGLPEGC